jgi:hypothetical protein
LEFYKNFVPIENDLELDYYKVAEEDIEKEYFELLKLSPLNYVAYNLVFDDF